MELRARQRVLLVAQNVTRISILYIVFYGLDFLIFAPGPTPIDRMLSATVHLVLFTAVMKIFSARTYRDYGYLATLSFLMMLASSVLTVGTTFLIFFIVYVGFAISTFISYEIKRGMEAAWRPPEGPFRTPDKNRQAIEKALMTAAAGLAAGICRTRRGAILHHSPLPHGIPDRTFHAVPKHLGLFRIGQSGRHSQNPALAPGGDAGDTGWPSARFCRRQVARHQSE